MVVYNGEGEREGGGLGEEDGGGFMVEKKIYKMGE